MAYIWSYKTDSYLINDAGGIVDVKEHTAQKIVEYLSSIDVLMGDKPDTITAEEDNYLIESEET